MKLETRVGLFILSAIAIFLYLSINIKAFRFDKNQYFTYKAYFDDTGGLAIKAPIRIAGVEVGWVESIELLQGGKVELSLRINKRNKLAKNAFAMIHQEGLIGTKTLEIDPGDPSTGLLLPGSTLSMPGRTPTSVGELLEQFRDIATSIQDITSSVKNVFASRQGEAHMKQMVSSLAKASDRLADFSEGLQRTLANNEDKINSLIEDFKGSAASLRENVPTVAKNVNDASVRVSSAFEQIEDASVQARDTFKEAGQVMEKINTGKGVVGKLINEDETYGDLKKTIGGFKEFVTKTQGLMLNVDMHSESMLRNSNSKGYFELKLRPNSDCFYLVQLVGDEQGTIARQEVNTVRKTQAGIELVPSKLNIELGEKVQFAENIEQTTRTKDAILFGLQFGKRFNRLAFRMGIFENTFGVGCDYYVPLETDYFHWITTLEAFDFRGRKRLHDSRPHVKWLNRAFLMKNFYTSFGIDDIFSKRDANPFFGGGLRFNDDDLKYFFSAFSGARPSGR